MTTQQENKTANDWLLNYHDKLESYQMMVNNFNILASTTYEGMPHGSGTSNPCQNKAMSLMQMDEYKKWLLVIEMVESALSDKMKYFLNAWRNAEHNAKSAGGRPGWYDQARNEYSDWFEKKYGGYFLPSNKTLQGWRNKIIDVTVRLAIRKGVI